MRNQEKGRKPLTASMFELVCSLGALLVLCSLLATCGPPGASGTSLETGGAAPVLVVNDVLVELDALAPPLEVDPTLFDHLKDALRIKLIERGEKIVGTPPEGPANVVSDLAAANFADGQLTLTWSYLNVGDYNQDGVVGIADLTPLAVHFGESTDYSSGAIPVDGNGDTFINVADITPLAAHFFVSCAGYVVQGSTSTSGGYDDLTVADLPPASGEGRTRLEATVELGAYRYFQVIPVDGGGNRGEPSNRLYYDIHPPQIVALNRTGGLTGEEVEFIPTVTGALPMSFQWDFGEGAEPNNPADEAPTVLLGAVGDYPASVAASNVFGQDVYEFTLTVTELPPEPPEIVSVEPAEVVQDRPEQFSAALNGDPPFTYDWEFGVTASPSSSSEPNPVVIFSTTEPVSAALTVTNPAGSDTLDFEITVYPPGDPPVVTAVSPTEGESGEAVQFSATVLGTPPFDFLWEFAGGADPNTSVDESPLVTLLAERKYEASVTASSIYGSDTLNFTLTVNPPSGEPPDITDLQPRSGVTGTEVTFTATVSGDEPLIFQWSFDGGAEPDSPETGEPHVMVTLGEPGEYSASLHATNDWGEADFPFQLMVEETPQPGVMVVVDENGNVGKYTSLAVIDGHPAIAYSNNAASVTKYIRASDEMGTSWGTPKVLDNSEGGWSFLTTVNGRPAVSYEGGDQDLMFVRAKDATGSQWNAPQTLVGEGWVPRQNSILIVEGFPAINYVNVLGIDLYYIHAKDADGADWNDPVHVDGTPEDRGTFSWMASVKGSPAISYNDLSDHEVRYIRSLNPVGTNWGSSVVIDSTGEAWYTHLVVAGGNPAVAYRHQGQSRLKYVRAVDDTGSAWGTPVTLDDEGKCGDWLSLAIINGRPAVSYFYGQTSDLRYVLAKDAAGSDWYSPIAIDTEGIVGYHTSLALVNGRPAISYYDSTNGNLKYVIANDAYGLDWPSGGG